MRAVEVEIVNPSGLHTRPGGKFVKLAREFQASVTVVKGERRGNGKSLLTLMKVGASRGDRVVIEVEGADEDRAAEELAAFVASLDD